MNLHPGLVFLLYYLALLAAVLVFHATGSFVLRLVGTNPGKSFAAFFDRSLAGLILWVFLFSAIVTSFKTIQVGFILVLLFLAREFFFQSLRERTRPLASAPAATNNRPRLLPLFFLSVVIYTWFACLLIKWQGDFTFIMPDKDKACYADISSSLFSTGIESRQAGMAAGTEPYHYFELWLNTLFAWATRAPAIVTMYLLSFPLLSLLTAAGVLSLFEKRTQLTWLHYILSLLLLFVGGLYFVRTGPDISWAQNFSETPLEFMGEKFGVICLFAVLSFRLLLDGSLMPGLTSFLIFPVLSAGYLPGVAGGMLLFFLIAGARGILKLRQILRQLFYLAILVALFILFYQLTGNGKTNPYLKNGLLVFTDLHQFDLKSVGIACIELFWRILHFPWKFVLLHLPFLVVCVLVARHSREYRIALLLVSCLYVASLLVYGVFYKLPDGSQFYTNMLAVINVFMLVGLALFICSAHLSPGVKRWLRITLTVVLLAKAGFALVKHGDNIAKHALYSDGYLRAVSAVHQQVKGKARVAALYKESPGSDLYNSDKNGLQILYLTYFPHFSSAVDLNVFELNQWSGEKETANIQKAFIRNSLFYRFVLQQVAQGTFRDIAGSQLDFLRKENIRYLVVSPGAAIDHRLVALVKKRIRDPRSGELFLVLNPVP